MQFAVYRAKCISFFFDRLLTRFCVLFLVVGCYVFLGFFFCRGRFFAGEENFVLGSFCGCLRELPRVCLGGGGGGGVWGCVCAGGGGHKTNICKVVAKISSKNILRKYFF